MNFCGLDVGTTGVKAIVFDEKGARRHATYRAYDIAIQEDGTRILRGMELWEKTKQALAEAVKKSGGNLSAVCCDSFGEAFVAMDANDGILCDPMLYTDRWGEDEYFEAEKKVTAMEIAGICGLPLSPTYSLSKLLYLKEQRPEIYERTKRILLIEDFINYMLCGCAAVDYSVACRTMFFDVANCEWSPALIEKFGLDINHYSKPVPTGTVLGALRPELSAELGVNADTKVVAGGHDQPINAIGAGLRDGSVVNSMGTTECITPIMDGMMTAETIVKNGIPSEPIWKGGKYCTMAYNPSSGLLVQWFFSAFTDADKPPYGLFEKNFPDKPTRIMAQPYLMGSGTPYFDHAARLAYTGMDLGTTKYDMYRATLEGLVMDQLLNISILRGIGVEINELVCVGGGSKSAPWLKVKADILQMPVHTISVGEAGALGCAVVCAAALGAYSSVEEAAHNMSHIDGTVEPDMRHAGFYAEKFGMYKKLHSHLMEESAFATAGGKQ